MIRFASAPRLLAASLLALGATTSSAQKVAYERYQLDNGMTVILHEDHSLPQASVNIWYYVGAKDEEAGRSGFAHLFEHLMFMGTERVAGSAFDDIMEAGGGSNNATTSQDRTNYFESGPAELLPTLLWLEADRLEDLGAMMTQEKLDKQRAVVRNERRQNTENTPYGRARVKVGALMYPEGHPYHDSVIGSHEDLEAATVDDVKNFFAQYYVPNNASLVVAGDFDPAAIKPLIAELFGTLPRGSDVVHAEAAPVMLEKRIDYTTTDAVQFAQTASHWHSPGYFQDGDAEMDLAAAVLSDGISSRLYQALVVEQELAVDVSAYQASGLLGSTFTISALARPGVELATIEAVIDAVVADFVAKGPTAEELERQKAAIEHGTLAGLQSIMATADKLNAYQFFYDEPDSFARDLDRYRDATPASVREWAAKVLKPDARLVMHVLPEAPAPETNPRDAQPAAAASNAFAPALPNAVFKLPNSARVQVWQRDALPLVELEVMLPFGSNDDPSGQRGVAALTAEMLDEGAGELDAVAFADALDQLGAQLSIRAGREWTTLTLSVLRRNFEPALALASSALLHPRFDEKEWTRVKDLQLQGLRQAEDNPNAVARTASMAAYFGRDHLLGTPTSGTIETVESIELEDLRRFHERLVRADDVAILVAGDVEPGSLRKSLIEAFGALERVAPALPPGNDPAVTVPTRSGLELYLVDRPGAVQTVVTFTMPAPDHRAATRPAQELVALILGGSFTSRLNQNLREDKGYTYGARARFSFSPTANTLSASANVRTDVTGASLEEFLAEFKALRSANITETEAEKARSTTRQRAVSSFASLGGILGAAAERIRYRQQFAEIAAELTKVSNLTAADLNALAAATLPLDQATLVLVGDKEAILPQLEGLGLPAPIELDARGEPVAGN